jgi:decaprenylphospho-beta-D-ribofuranose 2-oxidase
LSSPSFRTDELLGWPGFQSRAARLYRPARRRELNDCLAQEQPVGVIARGLGRSYGDCALLENGAVVLNERLNRMLAFDPESGLLTCESGVSFEEILETFVPRGFFLPVTPGTKFVTVGGAIASDIHGKNHHVHGSFGNFVESFDLLTAGNEVLHCSRSENADVFWATIGGMGLTGYVLSVSFRLTRIDTSWMRVDYTQVENLTDLLRLVMRDDAPTYSVAWLDCVASGDSMGRAVLMEAEHAGLSELSGDAARGPLAVAKPRRAGVPFFFPKIALNSLSVSAFNALYYKGHPTKANVLTSYEPFFYPLDKMSAWHRLYGRRGFVQYQALLPLESSNEGVRKLLDEIVRTRLASFLAVLKRTGEANEGMLSFCKPGITLALDIPNVGEPLRELAAKLDRILLEYGGRLYLAKDVLTTPETIAAMYPRLDEFRQVKARLDPQNRFTSAQAKRLRLTP